MKPVKKVLEKIQHQDHRELLSGAAISVIFKVLGMISSYIWIFIAIRAYGVSSYGEFSLCLAFLLISGMIGRLGFDSSVVKHVSQYYFKEDFQKIRGVYLRGLKIITGFGILITILLYASADLIAIYGFHQPDLAVQFRIAALGTIPAIHLRYNAGALRGLRKFNIFATLFNANFISAILFLGIFYLLDPEMPYALSYAYVAGMYLISGLSFLLWVKNSKIREFISNHEMTSNQLVSISLPMLFSGTLMLLNGWADTLILGSYHSTESVGTFQLLLKLSAVIFIVQFGVTSITSPKFAEMHLDPSRKKELQAYVTRSTKLMVVATVPLVLTMILLYYPLLKFFEADFQPEQYIWAYAMLIVGQVVNVFCGSGAQLLIMTGHQKVDQNIILFSFILNILINLALVPRYGIFGAAFANMVSFIVRNVLYVIYNNRLLNINTIYNPLQLKRPIRES